MPQCMYASVPQRMPIARLGLIHYTMPSHIRTPFSKSLVNVWVRVYACMRVCMRVYVRVTKGGLKACACLHVSVCICVCHTHIHTLTCRQAHTDACVDIQIHLRQVYLYVNARISMQYWWWVVSMHVQAFLHV